jgi:predicted Zn-dependent peptidase
MKLAALILLPALLAAQVKLPPYQRQVLPNGVILNLVPKKDVPLINVRVILRGGAEADPEDKAGLGSLTAELLQRGTTTRTADQFADQLDFIGANFRTSVDRQATTISIEFLKKDTTRALDLFVDALTKPAFREEEFKNLHGQNLDAARAAKDSPSQANGNYFRVFFFGAKHPYGRSVQGDEISLAKITREDTVKHHAQQYRGRNMIVTAVGDYDSAFTDVLIKALGSIPAGQAHTPVAAPPAPARNTPKLLLIDKPDATQTYFLIAQPGITRTHPDRVPLLIINTLFGGRFTSLLNEELRTNTGLTYGANSRVEQDRLPGAIVISSYTRTDTTTKAIDLALDIVNRLQAKGFDAEQLASAKAYIKGTYPTERLETNDQIAAVLGDIELNGLNKGEVDDFFSKIDSVTLEQANTVARKWINSANLQFCLLGNAAAIKEQVKKYAGKMEIVPITQPGYKVPQF